MGVLRVSFSELWKAFVRPAGWHAIVSRTRGIVMLTDDKSRLPGGWKQSKEFIRIPDRRDFNLGRSLVRQFVEENLPAEQESVREMFSADGAYRRFHAYLESKGLLENWRRFERRNYEGVLRAWARESGIEVSEH
jgi:hypothetical protein